MRVGLGLDPACEWTLNPGPALRCIVGRHRNVLPQLLLTVLLTITVCVLASSGHSPPGLYLQVNEVEREKISFQCSEPEPVEHHIITRSSGKLLLDGEGGERRRETLPKRPKLRLKLVRCVGGQLSSLVEEIVLV